MKNETMQAQGPVDVNVRQLVVVQKVWVQTSSDYNAVERTRTLAVTPETTVGKVFGVSHLMRYFSKQSLMWKQ